MMQIRREVEDQDASITAELGPAEVKNLLELLRGIG